MLYGKGVQIAEAFGVGSTVIGECKKLIVDHPERYGMYGTVGSLISVVAFVDAYKIRKIEPELWPPFMPSEALRLVKEVDINDIV